MGSMSAYCHMPQHPHDAAIIRQRISNYEMRHDLNDMRPSGDRVSGTTDEFKDMRPPFNMRMYAACEGRVASVSSGQSESSST